MLGSFGSVPGTIVGAIVAGLLSDYWYGKLFDCAASAHTQVEEIIETYGKNQRCVMKTTWSTIFITGITVTVA